MLKAQSIHYSIGKKNILTDINTEFLPGEINIILGPNGSGKSSFLKIFSGEIKDYSGNIIYQDKNIKTIKNEILAKYRAVMSQQPELSFPLTVDEVVLMGRYPHFNFSPTKKDINICNEVMDKMDLGAFIGRNYLTLSGGEKQRVQYARVLAQIWELPENGFRYLFLDEPLNSLDINYQQEFLQLAKAFTNSKTVFIAVLHDINLAIQYADKLYFLKEGKLISNGNPTEILTENLIKNIFKVEAKIITNPITNTPLIIF